MAAFLRYLDHLPPEEGVAAASGGANRLKEAQDLANELTYLSHDEVTFTARDRRELAEHLANGYTKGELNTENVVALSFVAKNLTETVELLLFSKSSERKRKNEKRSSEPARMPRRNVSLRGIGPISKLNGRRSRCRSS